MSLMVNMCLVNPLYVLQFFKKHGWDKYKEMKMAI